MRAYSNGLPLIANSELVLSLEEEGRTFSLDKDCRLQNLIIKRTFLQIMSQTIKTPPGKLNRIKEKQNCITRNDTHNTTTACNREKPEWV